MALEITDKNIEQILSSDQLVIVDFWAEWCGPCRLLSPIIDDLSKEYDGKAVIGKVDIESNDDIVSKYGIRNIPTILFFKNGEVVDKHVGGAQKATLAEKIDKLV